MVCSTIVGRLPHIAEIDKCLINTRLHIFDEEVKVVLNLEEETLPHKFRSMFRPPSQLTTGKLRELDLRSMYVSAKPDGVRCGLYIDVNGICYYIYPKSWRIYRVGVSEQKGPVLIDGELMKHNMFGEETSPYLLLFDLLYWEGIQEPSVLLRTKRVQAQELSKRVSIVRRIVNDTQLNILSPLSSLQVRCYLETARVKEVIDYSKIFKDGLTFTPKNGIAGEGVICWKPNPSITVGLEWNDCLRDFLFFFTEKTRSGPKIRYYDMSTRSVVYCKLNATRLSEYLGESMIDDIWYLYNKYQREGYFKKKMVDTNIILAELSSWYDPFTDISIMVVNRLRYDKKYPDNIDDIQDLLYLIWYPLTLGNIYRSRSFCSIWRSLSRRANNWLEYVKEIKFKVYERWIRSGKLLELCPEQGSDIALFYRLDTSKKIDMIHCLREKEIEETSYVSYDISPNLSCRSRMISGDMDNIHQKAMALYDTVVCAHSVQSVLDPYALRDGISNLSMRMKQDGYLLLLYLDGDELRPQLYVNVIMKHTDCDHDYIYTPHNENSEEVVHDPDTSLYYDWSKEDIYLNLEKSSVGYLYRYEKGATRQDNSYAQATHLWVKLPGSQKASREPIVRTTELVQTMRDHGFSLVNKCSYWDIYPDDEMENLAKLFKVAVFCKTRCRKQKSYLLTLIDDCIYHLLRWLEVDDIIALGQTHRVFSDICSQYLKTDKQCWEHMRDELYDRSCYYYARV